MVAQPDKNACVWVVGTKEIHKDLKKDHAVSGAYHLTFIAAQEFYPEMAASASAQVLIYQVTDSLENTLETLGQVSACRSDLCIILLGGDRPADAVAHLLRRGAFDYVQCPIASGRLAEAIASGLANRRTFLEVQNLSDELASANKALARERDTLKRYSQRLAGLNQLTQALAGSLKLEGVAEALFTGLPGLIGADVIAVVRRQPDQAWTWSRTGETEREALVRAQLLKRLDHAPSRITGKATTLRLVHSRTRPQASAPTIREAAADLSSPGVAVHDIPLDFGSQSTGVLHVERAGAGPFTDHEIQLLATVGTSLSLSMRNADTYRQIQDLALRDPLTGVLNRRALDGPMEREFKASLRYGASACLMLLDIDYFKTVNDRLGHTAGDQVLKGLAELMTDTVRDIDMVGRYGGEEFAVVLPHTTLDQAVMLGERLRRLIEDHAFGIADGVVRLTVSIGIAPVQDPTVGSSIDWVNAADAALYEAKAQGRNRVVARSPRALAPVGAVALCAA